MKARLQILPDEPRGIAWPSSARGVKTFGKSFIKTQKFAQTVLLSQATSETHAFSYQLLLRERCTLNGLPVLNGRKEWATVGQYGPKPLGYTRHTVDRTMGCDAERRS